MRHVVVGASGFLGRHLLAALPDAEGFDLPDWDVRDRSHCNSMPLTGATVWHLAADNSATRVFYDEPGRVLDVQIRGTMNMLDACLDQGAHTFVLFSSSEVFQGATAVPTPETVPLVVPDIRNPRFSYGGSKIAAELMVQWSALPRCLTLRPFNVFGEGQRPGHAIPDMLASFASGRPVFRGDANATRAFIHVSDFIAGCLTIAKHHEGDERTREVYNVGNDAEVRVFMLARHIEAAMTGDRGKEIAIEAAPEGSVMRRCPDVSKLRALGWSPRVDVIDAVRVMAAKTIAWHREQKK